MALLHHCDGFSQTRSALPPPPHLPTPPARAKPWAPLDWAPGPRARWRQGPLAARPGPGNHPTNPQTTQALGRYLAQEPPGDLQDTFT